MDDPLDPEQQRRWRLIEQYIQRTNQWEEAFRSEKYPDAIVYFEQSMTLLPTFIEDAKVWSKTHSFDATSIRGLEETALLYALTNNRGKLGWLRSVLERIPDLTKFLPIIDESMRARDATEIILDRSSRADGFLQNDLKSEVEYTEPGYLVSYLARFGLIRKKKRAATTDSSASTFARPGATGHYRNKPPMKRLAAEGAKILAALRNRC